MSDQKAGAKKENDSGSGMGIGTKLLLAGGAAAIGFFASEVWTEYKKQQERPYGASSSQSTFWGPPPSSTSWGKEQSSPRKQHRDKIRDMNVPEQMKCVVCMDNSREIVLLPCNHVCLCEDCVEKIDGKCPICRVRVRDSKAIYMS